MNVVVEKWHLCLLYLAKLCSLKYFKESVANDYKLFRLLQAKEKRSVKFECPGEYIGKKVFKCFLFSSITMFRRKSQTFTFKVIKWCTGSWKTDKTKSQYVTIFIIMQPSPKIDMAGNLNTFDA